MNINLINKIKKIDSIKYNPHTIQYPNAKYSNKSEFCLSILYNNIKEFKKFHENKLITNGHLKFGQLKLLISEIQFFTILILNKLINIDDLSNYVVIYIGSASGIHIPTLIKLFPFFKYVLVDPRNWSDVLMEFAETILKTKDSIYQPIDFIQKFVDNDICKDIKNIYKNKKILFISDIRNQIDVQISVNDDMKKQMDWVNILDPEFSFLKFRFNFCNGNYDSTISNFNINYLDGIIYYQAYSKHTSSETRLFVKKNANVVSYNACKYEEYLFYFNSNIRTKLFKNKFNFLPGLDDCYDCNIYVSIITDLFKMFKTFNKFNIMNFKSIESIFNFINYDMNILNYTLIITYKNKYYSIKYKDFKYGFDFKTLLNQNPLSITYKKQEEINDEEE